VTIERVRQRTKDLGPGGLCVFAGLVVALVVAPVIFHPGVYDDFTMWKQSSLLIAAGLILFGLAWETSLLPLTGALRILFALFLVLLVVSFVAGVDLLGSSLGVYQYRQGFLTQVAYLLLLLAGAWASRKGMSAVVLGLPALGLLGTLLYTAVQATGNDPITWWLDTSDRAIGTIGNANELSAYAISALACAGVALGRGRVGQLAMPAGATAAATFIIFEAESRSGILALTLFVVLVPVAWWLASAPLRQCLPVLGAILGGVAAGVALSLAAGGLAGSADRIQSGATGGDAGGSTRFALWEGTLRTIAANPLSGVGPDGLAQEFPRHREPGMGGAFESYDLVAQSSHNAVLDAMANYGVPGAAALFGLVGVAVFRGFRLTRGLAAGERGGRALALAALGAYGALTLLNPISLAAHAVFFAALGALSTSKARELAKGAAPARTRSQRFGTSRKVRTVGATALLSLALLIVGVFLPFADYRAEQAWGAYASGRFVDSAERYASASALMPLERTYHQREAEAWLAAGVAGELGAFERADTAYEEFDEDFGFSSGDALGQAAVWFALGREPNDVEELLTRALTLNPEGISMDEYVAEFRRALEFGGELRYSDQDRWVYVEANDEPR